MDKRTFSITAAKPAIKLDSKRTGEVSFTVTNTSDKPLRGQLKIRPVDGSSLTAAQPVWLKLVGDAERNFAPQATTQVTAKITVPDTVQPGKYGFRLDAVSAASPDDDLTEGPSMILELTAAQPAPTKRFPWWIVIAGGVAVLVIGGVVLWLASSNSSVTVPDPKNKTANQATANNKTAKPKVGRVVAEQLATQYAAALLAHDVDALVRMASMPFYLKNEVVLSPQELRTKYERMFPSSGPSGAPRPAPSVGGGNEDPNRILRVDAKTLSARRAEGYDAHRDRLLSAITLADDDFLVIIEVPHNGLGIYTREVDGNLRIAGWWS